jgi:hypothetical protein
MCGAPRESGRMTGEGGRRSRALLAEAGRVGRSHAWRWSDDHGFGKRWPRPAGFGEALQGLLPAPLVGDLERDPAVEIDPLKRNVRRAALRPPRIGQVLLRRVRDGGAGPQEEGEAARPDDGRFQRAGEMAALVEHGYWITWSARCSSVCGIVSLSAFAVFMLITSSNFVGCSTGRSDGFAPFRILSTSPAARRYISFTFSA